MKNEKKNNEEATATTPAQPMNIYQAMTAIMKSVEAIKKDKTNQQQKFKYRGIDDVMNALHDAFAENGVFLTTEVLERSEVERRSGSGGNLFYVTQKIRFMFHAPDGSNVSSTVYGTAMDSGDKADNKGLSIGLKYALLQAFLIPTEDMVDPDSETHTVAPETAKEQKKPQPAPAPQPQQKFPMPAEKYKAFCEYLVATGATAEAKKYAAQVKAKYILNEDQEIYLNMLLTGSEEPVASAEPIAPSN